LANETVTETQNNHNAKVEKFERQLRVKLTEKEIAERANRAAHALAEIDQKEQEREAANKHAKAQLAEIEAELRKVSTEVRDGATYRLVRCERVFRFRTGNVTETRLDTGELLNDRAMADWERQQDLPLDDVEELQRKSAAGESDLKRDDDEPPPAQTAKKRGRRPRQADAE